MFKKILMTIAIIVLAFVGIVAMQPDDFRYTRTASIAAPADKIFNHVNDLHKWEAWSPWAKLDPNAKTTFEGAESGNGATMVWTSDKDEVGTGKMTITESRVNEFIQFRLEFQKPMAATNMAEFTFKQEGAGTLVSWTMYGKQNFVGKAMGLIFNCEKMVGDMFDKGLANLKAVAETA